MRLTLDFKTEVKSVYVCFKGKGKAEEMVVHEEICQAGIMYVSLGILIL